MLEFVDSPLRASRIQEAEKATFKMYGAEWFYETREGGKLF